MDPGCAGKSGWVAKTLTFSSSSGELFSLLNTLLPPKSPVSLDPEGRSSLPKFLVILRAKMDTVGPSVGDVVRRLEVKCRCGKSFRFDPRNSNT